MKAAQLVVCLRSGAGGRAWRRRTLLRSFKSKCLAKLWDKGRTGKIDAKMQARILRRLDRLDVIVRPEEMNVPGFRISGRRKSHPQGAVEGAAEALGRRARPAGRNRSSTGPQSSRRGGGCGSARHNPR